MAYRNTKRDTVKALLSNKSMSKIIQDALQSPVGSTPRKRAQKIVSIMRKMQRNDGAGGPGFVMPSGPVPTVPQVSKKKIRTSVRVFQDVPMRGAKIFDGAGGPGTLTFSVNPNPSYAGSLSSYPTTTAQSTPATTQQQMTGTNNYGLIGKGLSYIPKVPEAIGAAAVGVSALGQYGLQNLSQGTSDLERLMVGNLAPQGPGYTTLGNTFGAKQLKSVYGTPAPSGSSSSITQPAWWANKNASYEGIYPGNIIPSTATLLKTGASTAGTQSGTGTSTYGPTYDPTYGTSSGTNTSGGGTTTTSLYGGIQNPTLRAALESGMGAGAFALSSMGNIDKLRALPGFENVPDDMLPFGADLSGQLDYLHETLTRETGVNEAMELLESQYNNYEDLVNGGVGLNERLTDYIRRKDEFLNDTNNLIDDFKRKVVDGSIDMYNPVVARQAESYLGYLSTLKGRQNKRYVEWVDQSVNVYSQQMQAQANLVQTAMNMYSIKSNELKDRYARGEKIALIEYEQIYNALSDMYNTAAGLPEKEMQMEMWQAELEKTRLDTILSTLDDTSGFEKLSDDYIKAFKFVNENIYDKDGNFLPGARNISALLSTYAGDSETAPEAVFDAYTKGIAQDFSGSASISDMITRAEAHYQGISQFQDYYTQLAAAEGSDPQMVIDKSKQLAAAVTSPLIDGVSNAIAANPDSAEEFKRALKALTAPTRLWGLVSGSAPSRDQFLKDYSTTNLPKSLLGALYTTYESYKDNPEFLWHIYANPQKYETDPGIDRMDSQELTSTAVANSLYAASQYNPVY